MVPTGPCQGVVESFDADAGYGTLRAADGREWWFHCTAIADGSRRIAEGATVVFRVVPGRQGRHEGVDVVTI
jgi:cold shock CspA family protein